MAKHKRCEYCEHFTQHTCRKNAPIVVMRQAMERGVRDFPVSIWPPVHKEDWCGDHESDIPKFEGGTEPMNVPEEAAFGSLLQNMMETIIKYGQCKYDCEAKISGTSDCSCGFKERLIKIMSIRL